MVLKAYYDGSGKFHDPGCRKVGLAGYVGSEDQWAALESAWQIALEKHPCPKSDRGNPYFHAKELFHRQLGYKGWTDSMVRALVGDLQKVLSEQGRVNLIGFSCTVDKAGYHKAKTAIPSLRPIPHMCLDHCIGNSFRHEKIASGMQIYFDRGEEFEPILKAEWEEVKDGQRTWWAKDVLHIGPVEDMRYSYALQASDFLAWTCNRYYTHGPDDDYGLHFSILNFINPLCHIYYDEPMIMDSFNADGSMSKGLRKLQTKIKFPQGTRVAFRMPPPPPPTDPVQ